MTPKHESEGPVLTDRNWVINSVIFALGRYSIFFAIFRTSRLVSSDILGLLFNASDTAPIEIPAISAMRRTLMS